MRQEWGAVRGGRTAMTGWVRVRAKDGNSPSFSIESSSSVASSGARNVPVEQPLAAEVLH